MPKEWYDRYVIDKIGDEDKKSFYRSIIADKKPYFMRYIYPSVMTQYNTYIKNTNKNCLREFGLEISELKAMRYDSLTERQIEFLRYYDRGMPVGINNCVMNQICRKFELTFDNYTKGNTAYSNFDYSIMKSDAEYTTRQYYNIKSLYEAYTKRLSNFKAFTTYETVDKETADLELERIKNEFIEECDKTCPRRDVLCNILLDICYKKNSTKRFVWSVCGDEIIKNLLRRNNHKISFPVLAEDGEFEYGGNGFNIETKEVEVDNEYCTE